MIPENIAAADREGITILNAKLRQANNHVTAKTDRYGSHNFTGEKFIDSAFKTPSHNPNQPNPIIIIRLKRKESSLPKIFETGLWDEP